MYLGTLAFICLVLVLTHPALANDAHHVGDDNDDRYINDETFLRRLHNQMNMTWVAGTNHRFVNRTLRHARGLCGTKIRSGLQNSPLPTLRANPQPAGKTTPASFDARVQWPACAGVIGQIRDQLQCGSCWAFASTEAFNDRLCIVTNGALKTLLSAQDTTSCCTAKNGCPGCAGCDGGFPDEAWAFFRRTGVVTGGDYDSIGNGTTCYPYQINPTDPQPTAPKCPAKCSETAYPKAWATDLHFASSAFSVANSVTQIQSELMNRGPLTVTISVYSDFMVYKSGVYKHVSGSLLGGHAMKLVGWGVENNAAYWMVANSWGPLWGLNGFVKIARGSNECGIENGVVGGIAKK